MPSLKAISPIDGRYAKDTLQLSHYFSEHALIRYRIMVEGEYLIFLSQCKGLSLRNLSSKEIKFIRSLYECGEKDAEKVKEFESATNHDVKAVEYFLKEKFNESSLKNIKEWIHFALTSEDTNNLAYALMFSESLKEIIIPSLEGILKILKSLSKSHAKTAMLARTHGQPASPTTFGKEFKVFAHRLERQVSFLKKYALLVKLNGASGNYNAHCAAYPKVNWVKFSKDFIGRLAAFTGSQLEVNLFTTQIESHDTYAELFDAFRRINVILISFNQDMWRYISDGWIVQRPKAGEVGSSTMPHKVNPINFENSEGNLGMANALLSFFSQKLPIVRLQRDLTDSTVERNFGTALAHCLLGYQALTKGLEKIEVNKQKVREDLLLHPEVISEAIQTILRREEFPLPYEKLKEFTRGKVMTTALFEKFINSLEIEGRIKKELLKIAPEGYIGLADTLSML